jgi:hypothetical protein
VFSGAFVRQLLTQSRSLMYWRTAPIAALRGSEPITETEYTGSWKRIEGDPTPTHTLMARGHPGVFTSRASGAPQLGAGHPQVLHHRR